jgi:RNA polymerase sigma factor (sigma-70 family)
MSSTQAGVVKDMHQPSRAETGGASDRQLLERFIAQRDEAAFAGLLQRHGRMVWRVCRRVLHQQQESEDAFQAVFLVLARRAGSIRKAEAVGSWLYGVAYRISMKARRRAVERTEREKQAAGARGEQPAWADAACRELQRLLDEEVQRLAQKHREPFVLCCLEGMSRAEAARELGLKEGTVASRLAHARALLQKQLARRGVTLSAALAVGALATGAAAAPAALVRATAQAVAAPAAASPAAVALADGHVRALDRARRRPLFGLLLLLGTLSTATGVTAWQGGAGAYLAGRASLDEADTFVPPAVGLGTPVDERVLAVAFAPDGRRLITAGGNPVGQLQVWDTVTNRELVTLRGIPGVRAVAFAPDGQTFATGDQHGQLQLRDAATGEERAAVQAHDGGVAALAYSPDGRFLVSAGPDRVVRLWDRQGPQEQTAFPGHADAVTSVAYFRNGRAIVSGSRDQTAIIWDVGTGHAERTLRGHHGPVAAVTVSPDDALVATAGGDHTVRLWDAQTGQEAAVLQDDDTALSSVAFSPDGTLLAAARADGTIGLWGVRSRRRFGSLVRHDAEVSSLAFAPDGTRLASGSADKTAKIWDLSTGDAVATLRTVSPLIKPIQALAYSPDGSVLAMATRDRAVQVRDGPTGDVLRLLLGHQDAVNCLAFSSDGHTLATGSTDRTVKLWDWATGDEQRTLIGHTGAVYALAFTADGKRLASAGQDGAIKMWDAPSGRELTGFPGHAAAVRALAFAPDRPALAGGGDDGTIWVWDLAGAREPVALSGHRGAVCALAFSAGGVLASAGDDADVKLWDVARAEERRTLTGHEKGVLALAFTPSGRTLVSGGRDNALYVWDSETGRARTALKGHKGAVTALAMHPQGQHLVSGSEDTMLLRWQGAKGAAIAAGRGRAHRRDVGGPSVPNASPDAVIGAGPTATPSRRGRWLVPALLVFLAITGTALVAWVRARRERDPVGSEVGAAAAISCSCPGCGKALRVKRELAGKKVKCPGCARAVPVPAAREAPRPSPVGRRWAALAAAGALVAAAVGIASLFVPRPDRPDQPDQPVSSLFDQPFGAQPLDEVGEDGFYGPEVSASSGVAYRWTNGAAKLVIPLQGPPPKGLHVQLILPGLPAYRLSIRANQQLLFEDHLGQNGVWSQTFDLSKTTLGKELTLEVLSDTFVPAQKHEGSTDQRALGVRLVGVTLISGTRGFLDVPLGVLELPEVPETGFHQPDAFGPNAARWTDGAAHLTVPVRGPAPRALALTLGIPCQPDYRVAITVNGVKLFDDQFNANVAAGNLAGRDWSAELPLPSVGPGESLHIDLDSSTFVPAEALPGSRDHRKLGVRVKRLILVPGASVEQK